MALSSEPLNRAGNIERKEPYIGPGETLDSINNKITDIVFTAPRDTPRGWFLGFGIAFLLLMVFLYAVTDLLIRGVGVWGINIPVAWAWDIINFVWWIGIGHAGTLISAILLLFAQDWRNSINRFAEAMTLFAVACAGLFPILHLGRPWFFYWLIPYPNTFGMWPQFRSALTWDVFAISTYALISLLFWLIGLVPDFAKMRDTTKNSMLKFIFGIASLGWRGSAKHWNRYEIAYILLAGLSTPLVVSVHSIISLDFAISVVPGWNPTIFPPYFVAGAVFAGFAMVLLLVIPIRHFYGLQNYITMKHIDNMCKIMLATGLVVVYGYIVELYIALYSGVEVELALIQNRVFGIHATSFWALIFFNGLAIQPLWFKSVRRNLPAIFIISISISIGMWLERFVIIVNSLSTDYLPSSWAPFYPTIYDVALYVGTLGLFFTLLFLFIRTLPMINIFEMQMLQHKTATGSSVVDSGVGEQAMEKLGDRH
ncbi:MAG: polysulfide reductase NrfD [Chloroflexaceae bacterium]|nr:polysulfide reductase NrfD [Chloroflexaceae bacterium]NJO04498.1 polysulfide reductase NrfD [Chloroflexaceae bacterium]